MLIHRWELLAAQWRERVIDGVRVVRSSERLDVVARCLTPRS
jgi:hypothetical protein